MGDHQLNKPMNSCSLCGQCTVVCPNGFDMAHVCHLARQNMVSTDKMPLAPHEFALMDMLFSNNEAFLARPQPGFERCRYAFFPGCQAVAIAPETVKAAYLDLCERLDGGVGLILGCCGAIGDWAGRTELEEQTREFLDRELSKLGDPILIVGCPSCKKEWSSHPGVQVVGIWDLLLKLGLPESTYSSLEETVVNAFNSTDHSTAVSGILGFVDSFTSIIITIAFSILFFVYFLIDMPMISKYWSHAFQALLPEKIYRGMKSLIDDIREVFSNYIRGEMTDGLVIGIIMSVALSLAGVRYSVLIGVVTGIGNLIPYMGPILGYIMTILSGILSGDFKAMAIGLVICAIVQVLDGAIINPRLLSNSVEVHAIITTLALIAGSKIGGLFGMVCAIPSAALFKIWFERLVTKMEKKKGMIAEETETE